MKKGAVKKELTKSKSGIRNASEESKTSYKEEPKPKPKDEEEPKIRPLKDEVKNLDLLNTLMLQYAYSVHLLDLASAKQTFESESELYDRGKQLIDLKKQVNNLKIESQSRNKTKTLDDILSMEYSSLKPVESDILVTNEYLKELKNNSAEFLNRVDLDRGVIISPKDLEMKLQQTALELNSLVGLIEDDAESVKKLAQDFKEVIDVVREQHETLERIKVLKDQVQSEKIREKVEVVQKVLHKREVYIQNLLLENI